MVLGMESDSKILLQEREKGRTINKKRVEKDFKKTIDRIR